MTLLLIVTIIQLVIICQTATVRYVDGQKIVVMPPVYVTPRNRPVSL